MSKVQVKERESVEELPGESKGEVAVFQPPRLPWHRAIEERYAVTRGAWKVLVEAIFPLAKSVDSIVLALAYCQERKLDVMKKPVHIVPMWNGGVSNEDGSRGGYVDTIWPSIAELRTTAFRTGDYAGKDATEFGRMIDQTFKGRIQGWENGRKTWKDASVSVRFPEWAQITVYRMIHGVRCAFVGPQVYWTEAYATIGKSDLPNEMWQTRSIGQIDKCAEAAALRCAFPEEIGNQYSAEEMEGRRIIVDAAEVARDVTPQTMGPRKAPPPPAREAASEAPKEVVESPSTAPAKPVEGEILPPAGNKKAPPPPKQSKPQAETDTDIPEALRRKPAPKVPNPRDPEQVEAFLKYAEEQLAASDDLADVWMTKIEPHIEGVPADVYGRLSHIYDAREEALAQ